MVRGKRERREDTCIKYQGFLGSSKSTPQHYCYLLVQLVLLWRSAALHDHCIAGHSRHSAWGV